MFSRERSRLLNPAHLERTQRFYERHGGKTVVIARFVPDRAHLRAVRRRHRHDALSAVSVLQLRGRYCWIGSLVYAGYYFGNMPLVKQNLTLVILGIIVLSIMPGVVEFAKSRMRKRAS